MAKATVQSVYVRPRTVRLTAEQDADLEALAGRRGEAVSDVIRRAIDRELTEAGRLPPPRHEGIFQGP